MIKSNEFDRFYEVSWKFEAVDLVVKKLRGNISRIWNDIPALLKNINGQGKFQELFNPLYKELNKAAAKVDKCSTQFHRLFKKTINRLQKYGVFINNPFTVDTLGLRVKQGNVVTETVMDIFEEVKKEFHLTPTDIDISKPNVFEIYIIAQAKIDATIIFLEACRKELNSIVKNSNTVKQDAEGSMFADVANAIEETNKSFDEFIAAMKALYDKLSAEVAELNKVLDETNISFSITDERKQEIIQQVRYCEIYDTYSQALMLLKPNEGFNRLMGNRTSENSVHEKIETVEPMAKEVLIQK